MTEPRSYDEVPDLSFRTFGKIARLNRECTITEKIDGTNAAVHIAVHTLAPDEPVLAPPPLPAGITAIVPIENIDPTDDSEHQVAWVAAQSRKRIITPGSDNFGFARWVADHAAELVATLGEGLHFGEWWGAGIQRKYGMLAKKFSLFNTSRWTLDNTAGVEGLGVVPVLYQGQFSSATVAGIVEDLRSTGSRAAPGFEDPEGVVVHHVAGNHLYKVTLENDEEPKSARDWRAAQAAKARAAETLRAA